MIDLISTDGKYVDISLFELHFGQKVEILLEMDSDKINHGLTVSTYLPSVEIVAWGAPETFLHLKTVSSALRWSL
jgi:hypothetical protein